MKILPDQADVCPYCREVHPDNRHAAALGRALGHVKRLATLKAKRAWVCPPMPMPDPIVAEVEGIVVILPPLPLVVDPPLTPEEIARAAVFVLTGKVREIEQAILKVRSTPWPEG